MSLNSPIPTATFALAVGVQAQTPPASPSIPGDLSAGDLVLSGTVELGGQRRLPRQQDLWPGAGADTRQISSAIDKTYQKIMQRPAAGTLIRRCGARRHEQRMSS